MVTSFVEDCVQKIVEKEKIKNHQFAIEGGSSVGEGYLGDITFVTISGLTEDNIKKKLEIAIKSAAQNNRIRERIPIRDCFLREIHHYENTVSAFNKLQKEKNVYDLLNYIPKIYFNKKTKCNELLALENLKSKDFDNWERKLPMTFEHIKLVLTAYGKWHALSFALKQKDFALFEKLIANNINMISKLTEKMDLLDYHLENFKYARDETIDTKSEGYQNLQFSKEDIKHALIDSFYDDLENSVILHGDCWNSNFLFKTNTSTNQPSEVKIIDWQCTSLGSPVMDLSHFIYCCVDTNLFKNVEVLLKIYYRSLETTLAKLGYNANDIFNYEKLMEHWQRFSKYGLVFSCFMVKLSISESEEIVDMAQVAENEGSFSEAFNIIIKDEAKYLSRAKNNLEFYVYNLKNK